MTPNDPMLVAALDVRRADADIPGFVARILDLIETPTGSVTDLPYADHGNRILLRTICPGDSDDRP